MAIFTGSTDIRATGQTINSATLNAAISVSLNNGEAITSFQVAGLTASGATLTIECSDDGGTTWFTVNGITAATGVLFTTLTTDQSFRVGTGGRTNVRLRVSIVGTGTITIAYNASIAASAVVLSSPLPAGSNIIGQVVGNVASAVTDSGNPVKIGAVYNTTQPTVTTGQRVDAQADVRGNIFQNMATQIDPTNDTISILTVASSQNIAVTTSGAGYILGDNIGGIISLSSVNYASGRRVILRGLQVNDKGGVAPSMNIYFFKVSPSGGVYTDNTGLTWGTGDTANKVGQIRVQNGDYLTDISQSSVNYSGLYMPMQVSATTLFMLIVSEASYTLTNGNLSIIAEFDMN